MFERIEMKKKKKLGRPRVDSVRLVLRLPAVFVKQMMEMGGQLSLDTPQATARHFMTIGMQASLGALSSSRSVDVSQEMLAVMKDMFSGQETPVETKPRKQPGPARRVAAPGRSSTMLDTNRINRNRQVSRKQG
jgi:hypothetical protein